MSKGPLSYPIPLWILGPLALIPGSAAMLHVLRQLESFALLHGFGVATQTTVLATFMAGFAVGAIVVGLRADRSQHPLRWFGLLQIGLGCFALGAPTLRDMLGATPTLGTHALVLLAVPGLLAGGTTTVLVRASSHTTERGAMALGCIVGMTALGAAAALPLAPWAAVLGVALPIAGGVVGWALSAAAGSRERFASDGEHIRIRWTGDAGFPVLFGLVVVGAILPVQRFAWNRLLPFALDRGDAATIGFLLHMSGLGLGALAGTLLVSGGHNARRLLARVLLFAAVLTGLPLFYGDALLRGGGLPAAAALVWPGAMGAGLILPLVARVGLSDRESVARQSGAMFGLFCVGWAFSLYLVVPRVLEAMTSTDLIVASAAALLAGGTIIGFGKGLREWVPAGSATLLVVLVVLGGTRTDALAGRMAVVRNPDARRRVVDERQSAMATFAVVEDLRNGSRRLYRNGLTGAPAGQSEIGHRLLGHLPAVLHPHAKRALVARFGSGTAAGALAQHPPLAEIHVVAEDEAVFELAPRFALQNRNVLADAKVRRHVAEMRPFLRSRPGMYDIVTLEPGAADSRRGRLQYTAEFYGVVHAALAPGGMLCQRLPTESYGPDLLRRVVRAAGEHFGLVTLWDFADGLYLLATDKAPKLEAQPLILRFSKVGLDLQQARVGDTVHLLASCAGLGSRFAPANDVEPLRDADSVALPTVEPLAVRRMLAEFKDAGAVQWAGDLYEGLDGAVERARRLRALLARNAVASDELAALADADRGDLRARAAAEERLYEERVEKGDFGGAARLDLVRDRTDALLGLVRSTEGDRRDYYAVLLLREGVSLPAAELERLAAQREGAERRYILNRVRMLRREAPEDGGEKLPDVELRDPTPALDEGDEATLRDFVLDAECGRREQEFDAVVFDWIDKSSEQRRTVLLLHKVGWWNSVRAARKLAGRGVRDDLVALAPLFASAYPEDRTWERLCRHADFRVRAAAAEAARAFGGPAHVEHLLKLCEDRDVMVRTGAFHSLEAILGDGVKATGYDPENPAEAALEKLRALR